MKHLKMLGLALVAAAAFMAVIGAGTASATELCSTATTPCSGTKYGTGTIIDATLEPTTTAVLTTSITTVTCTASTVKGETTSAGGATTTAVTGKTLELTFTGCTRTGGEPCTVKATNLGTASVTGGSASSTGKFNYNVTSKTGANVTCGFFINCTFSTSSATLAGVNQAGGTPTIKAENIVLAREGGLCPETSTWTAAYEVQLPMPLFVV
jgi:hypothetical protein